MWKAEVGADESGHGFDLIKFTFKNRSDVEVLFWSFLSVNFGSTVDNCYFLCKLVATVFLGARQPALNSYRAQVNLLRTSTCRRSVPEKKSKCYKMAQLG